MLLLTNKLNLKRYVLYDTKELLTITKMYISVINIFIVNITNFIVIIIIIIIIIISIIIALIICIKIVENIFTFKMSVGVRIPLCYQRKLEFFMTLPASL